MDVDINPRAYLARTRSAAQAAGHADVVAALGAFEAAYDRKLWHQLSCDLERFLTLPDAATYVVDLYHAFVRDFETKLNKLSLVAGLGAAVARHLPGSHADRIAFALQLAERVKPAEPKDDARDVVVDLDAIAAHLLALTTAAYYQLLDGQFEPVLRFIAKTERQIDAMDSLDPRVSSAFYRVAADYYKAKSAYAKFYKTSLLFLACLGDVAELGEEEARARAYELGVAALMSDEIYNFGELLLHPILDYLDNTPRAWIKAMLIAFNKGDIVAFEGMASNIPEPLLVSNLPLLRQKICLLALVDHIFTTSAGAGAGQRRVLPFSQVARATRLPEGEVEYLLMKALALSLIRGAMDQVDQTVTVTWVAPRVLDRSQVGDMAARIEGWTSRITELEARYRDEGAEVFASA